MPSHYTLFFGEIDYFLDIAANTNTSNVIPQYGLSTIIKYVVEITVANAMIPCQWITVEVPPLSQTRWF